MNASRAHALLLLAALIWGMGFIAQSTAMADLGPITFTGLRFLAAAIALSPLAWLECRRMQLKPSKVENLPIRAMVITGTVLFAAQAFQQAGLVTTTVTNSGFLTGTYVLLVPLISLIVMRIVPHPAIWPCAFAVIAGIYLLSGGQLSSLSIGDGLTMICAIFWAIHVLLIGRLAETGNHPFTLAFTQFLVCGLLGTLIGLPLEQPGLADISVTMVEILFAGVISGGVAFTLQIMAQRHTTSSRAAIFLASEALFAALFGAVFLGERLSLMGLAGCGLIFAAIISIQLLPEPNRNGVQTAKTP